MWREKSSLFEILVLFGARVCTVFVLACTARNDADVFIELGEGPNSTPFTDSVLELSASRELELDVDLYRQKIAQLANKVRAGAAETTGRIKASDFVHSLYGSGSYTWGIEHSSLTRLLDSQTGDCVAASMLARCVGEALGVDMQVIVVPFHMYVRVKTSSGKYDFDLSSGIGVLSELHEPYFFYEGQEGNGFLGQPLTDEQALGAYATGLASNLLGENRYERALELITIGRNQVPNSAYAQLLFGLINFRFWDIENAELGLSKALELEPGDASLLASICRFSLDRSELEAALELGRRVVEIEPNFPPHQILFSDVLVATGSLEEALAALELAMALNPEELHPVRKWALASMYPTQRDLEIDVIIRRGRIYTRTLGPITEEPEAQRKRARKLLLANLSAVLSSARDNRRNATDLGLAKGLERAEELGLQDDPELDSIVALIGSITSDW
ncbi:MAG: tetratricopeptide (TPR) repeat protein [Planctomycetota bacterium]|jgi:tetratricopeptide (TPR) repeat protein